MLHHIDEGSPTPPDDDQDGIPDFLKRQPAPPQEPAPGPYKQQQELPMRTDDETTAPEAAAAPVTEAPPSKPAKAAGKPKAAKAVKAKAGNGNGHVAPKATKKAAGKAAAEGGRVAKAKTAKPAKAKAKGARAERQRDPAKLDQWGFRKDSIKSRAASIYAKGKGATLAQVKEVVGSIQFNLLTELKEHGFKVEVDEVKNTDGRVVNRYKLHAKA